MQNIEITRRRLLLALGGSSAIAALPSEVLADALEHELLETNYAGAACEKVAILDVGRDVRRGGGMIFDKRRTPKLMKMPERPTLADFFRLRSAEPVTAHCLKSARHALKDGQPERNVMAALVHDIILNLMKSDHAWWGADLVGAVRGRAHCVGHSIPPSAALLPGQRRNGLRIPRAIHLCIWERL